MPIQVTYPGVYVQEIPGGQPVVAGVSTASTAFVDFFARGPMNEAVRVASMQDVERLLGGLHRRSEASYGLRQYFLNGGQEGWVVRAGDGTARKSSRDVRVRTPGLPARVKASLEDFQLAQKAAGAAVAAAKKAAKTLQDLQKPEITDQEREQGSAHLRGSTDEAAEATQEAAEATRQAAVQAKAASDELAIAIAKIAAASGPVADRTAAAAQKAADAAQASSDAAKATNEIAAVAQRAAALAEAALRAGQAARTAGAATEQVDAVLAAIGAAGTAATAAAKAADEAGKETALTGAQQAAGVAASQALEAAAQLEAAVAAADAAARTVVDKLKAMAASNPEDGDTKTRLDGAQKALSAIEGSADKVTDAATKAADADWAAQTAVDVGGAQKAATDASAAAAAAAATAGAGDKAAAGSIQATVVSLLGTVLDLAAAAASDAAYLAGKAPQEGKSEPVDPVIFSAIQAIDGALGAAKKASRSAKAGADDAKVAADSVTSGVPALAARGAESAATKAQKESAETAKQAKAVKLQVNQANLAAQASAAPATAAGKAAGDLAKSVKDAADGVAKARAAAQAASNAADNVLGAAESVEKAAVATSQVSVVASKSADVAAQAAEAAVLANQEANLDPTLIVEAINEGIWGDNLEVTLEVQGTLFNFSVREMVVRNGVPSQVAAESFNHLTLDEMATTGKQAVELVNHNSNLVRLRQIGPKIAGAYPDEVKGKFLEGGADGGLANADQLVSAMKSALDGIEPAIFNLLCLPAVGNFDDAQASVAIAEAQAYCAKKRAFFLIDIPERVKTVDQMLAWVNDYGNAQAFHMAVYFPRLVLPDPLNDYRPRNVGPSGTLAGIYARTDTARGVWKAPAGVEAVLQGAEVAVRLNDDLNGLLNPRGVNVLRSFPIYGNIAWGARTLAGADALSSEYKYINVRRLMNYIEESVYRAMKWAVFEPNNETLWGKIRLQINGFLGGLFSDGAFQGATPAASYFVQVDGTTTTPLDIEMGVVNVFVGVAPVKPAEFIILHFQQMAGQAAA